jgi:hypothetical protein
MITGFFNLYKPRKFNHRFIYYDPRKEALKERQKNSANGITGNEYRHSLHHGSFREEADRLKRNKSKELRRSNIEVIIILSVLLLLVYFLFLL